MAHLWAKWLRHPCCLGDPHRCTAGGGNQKWPTCGQSGYVNPAVSRIPTAAQRRGKSEVAHLWAKWLRHPCRLGDPHCFRAGGGGNQKWPTCGQSGHVTPAVSGIPTASERGGGGDQKWPTSGQSGYVTPAVSGIPTASEPGGRGIRSGPLVGKVATSPLPSRGSPPLKSGGQNQKWPTSGQGGYVTLAVSGIPTASERGGESKVAHLWAKWLRRPCRLGDPHRCTAGGGIRSGPLMGKVATSPLPSRGSPPLHSGGQNQKWPTSGQSGYVTPAVSGIPNRAERGGGGGGSEVAHKWAKWLCHPCRLGDPHRCTAGGGIRSGPLVGKVATSPAVSGIPTAAQRGGESQVAHLWAKWLRHPCRLRDPHRCRAGGGNQKWPTYGQSGYVTPAVSGIPTASERGGGGIRSGPQVGKVAMPPLPSRGSPPLHSGGGNQKWPTCGQSGHVTPAVSGIPTAAQRGGESEVAHKWAKWLCHPCRLGDPHRYKAGGGGGIRSGPQVGKVATSPLPSRGSPPLHSGGGGIRSGPLVNKVAT